MQQTLFLDIDGCIFKHWDGPVSECVDHPSELLPGVKEKISKWFTEGHYICITTARPECWRRITEKELLLNGIPYHQLVMGIGHGLRIVVNDTKPNMKQTAYAITIKRNEGFENLKLPIAKYELDDKQTGVMIFTTPENNYSKI